MKIQNTKKIPVIFHNGSTYDYHFIINQLAKEYITFSVPINKKLDNNKTITYRLKFIDSFRFMSISLSNHVDNLSEICQKECKRCEERRKIKSVCNFIGLENNKLNCECKECKKDG